MRLREITASMLLMFGLVLSTGCSQPQAAQARPAEEARTETSAAEQAPAKGLREPDVIYVPTPPEVVTAMLKLAGTRPSDVLYDLGSGDGRIVIAAVRDFGVTRATGIDINPERIREANAAAGAAKVTDRVRFLNEDLFEADFSEATVVTLYLLPSLNLKLLPKLLRDLEPGTRIVSHDFDMGDWKAEETVYVDGRYIYLWTIPDVGTPEYGAAMAAAAGS